jgi:hypothetical protein
MESNQTGDIRRYQLEEKESNWLQRVKKDLEQLGMGDIWSNGQENVKKYEE